MKQMSFCEDDCEISSTFACTSAVVENVRPTTSGTPTMPGPPTRDQRDVTDRGERFHAAAVAAALAA